MRTAARSILGAGTALVALAAFTGCASAGDDGTISLTVWSRAASIGADVEDQLAAEFPDWDITVSRTGQEIDDKIRNGLRSGSGLPDVAILAGNLPDYFEVSDQFVDLSEQGFSGGDDYVDWALQSGQDLDGRQVALPTDIGPYGMFYRADIAQELGYPTDPAEFAQRVSTWDDYAAFAAAASGAGYFACDSANSAYQLQLVQQGYQYYENTGGTVENIVESDINRNAYDSAAGLIADDACANVEPYTTEWNSAIAQNSVVAFIGPGYEEGILKPAAGDSDQWRVAATPGGAGVSTGSFVAAMAKSDHPEEAAQVAQFLASPEVLKSAYLTQGLFPSASALYDDPELTAPDAFYGGEEAFSVLTDAADQGVFAFRGPGFGTVGAQFRQALTDVATAGADPDEKYDAVVAEYSDYLG